MLPDRRGLANAGTLRARYQPGPFFFGRQAKVAKPPSLPELQGGQAGQSEGERVCGKSGLARGRLVPVQPRSGVRASSAEVVSPGARAALLEIRIRLLKIGFCVGAAGGAVELAEVKFRSVQVDSDLVEVNSSLVVSNFGSFEDNFGLVKSNFGSVEANFGLVESNFGSVEVNFGFVKSNFGSVEVNFGIVKSYFDLVESNFGLAEENSGLVEVKLRLVEAKIRLAG